MNVLALLDDMEGFVAWHQLVGREEAARQLDEACRAHMEEYGICAILDVGEKMEHLAARMEEFSP